MLIGADAGLAEQRNQFFGDHAKFVALRFESLEQAGSLLRFNANAGGMIA